MKLKNILVAVSIVGLALIALVVLKSGGESTNTGQDNGANQSARDLPAPNPPPSSSNTTPVSGNVSATIAEFAYKPSTLTVKKGTTVTWTNQDSVRHNVASEPDQSGGPSGPLLAQGESYSFTFNTVGTFRYLCTPHPYMKGMVIVTD